MVKSRREYTHYTNDQSDLLSHLILTTHHETVPFQYPKNYSTVLIKSFSIGARGREKQNGIWICDDFRSFGRSFYLISMNAQ